MKKLLAVLLTTVFFLSLSSTREIFGHPGALDNNNCHHCVLNCKSLGVPYLAKHCHTKEEVLGTNTFIPIPENPLVFGNMSGFSKDYLLKSIVLAGVVVTVSLGGYLLFRSLWKVS